MGNQRRLLILSSDSANSSISGEGLREVASVTPVVSLVHGEAAYAARVKADDLQNAMYRNVNFLYIATDEKGVIQLFNAGAERLLGYTASEVVGKITPAELSDPLELVERAAALTLEFGIPI